MNRSLSVRIRNPGLTNKLTTKSADSDRSWWTWVDRQSISTCGGGPGWTSADSSGGVRSSPLDGDVWCDVWLHSSHRDDRAV